MKFDLKKELPMIFIILIPFIIAAIVYPAMPDMVPIHWNINGEVDDYASKAYGTFFMPLMNLGMYLLFLVMPRFDPKRANYEKFSGSYRLIRYAMHIFFSLIFILMVLATFGKRVDIGLWVSVGVALLFIFMGNVMGRIRYNYFVGFRLPWTLASEEVWKKTHQFGAKAMVIGGVAALAGVLMTENSFRFVILMAGIFIPIILIFIYSYLIYRRGV